MEETETPVSEQAPEQSPEYPTPSEGVVIAEEPQRDWFKIVRFPLLALVLFLLAGLCFFILKKRGAGPVEVFILQPETDTGRAVYTNKNNGFSLKYPQEWKIGSTGDEFAHLPSNTIVFEDEGGEPVLIVLSLSQLEAGSKDRSSDRQEERLGLIRPVLAAEDLVRIALSLEDKPPTIASTAEEELFIGTLDDNFPYFAEMMLSENENFAGASWETFTAIKQWVFGSPDGEKEIYGRFKDSQGNIYNGYGSFLLDTAPPTGNIYIPEPAVGPGSLFLSLNLYTADNASGVAEMRVGERSDFYTSLWEDYAISIDWPLPDNIEDLQHGDIRTAYVQYKDHAGHVSDVYSADYTVDKEGPVVYVDVPESESFTRIITILSYDELSSLAGMQITNDPLFFEGVITVPYQSQIEWTFDERRVVWVRIQDSVGNWSPEYPAYAAMPEETGSSPTPTPTPEPTTTPEPPSEPASGVPAPSTAVPFSVPKPSETAFIKLAALTEQTARSFFPTWDKREIKSEKVGEHTVSESVYAEKGATGTEKRFVLTTFAHEDRFYVLIALSELSEVEYEQVVKDFTLLQEGPRQSLPGL